MKLKYDEYRTYDRSISSIGDDYLSWSFFLIDNNIPAQALHKEEQLLEDDDDLADFSNAVRNGDYDLEEIQIQSMEAADIYNDADDNMKDCIGPATEVGHSLSNREVIHCVDDANYFQNKYSSISTNSTVRANTTFATSTAVPDTHNDTAIDTTSTSDTSTSDTSTSDTSTSDTSTSDTSTSDTSIPDIPTSNTSASDTSDFGYINFGYIDSRYTNFGYINFGYINFGYINFGYIDYRYTNFGYIDYRYTNFGYINYRYTNLR